MKQTQVLGLKITNSDVGSYTLSEEKIARIKECEIKRCGINQCGNSH